jgi:murein L,D-transpeptidase YafK
VTRLTRRGILAAGAGGLLLAAGCGETPKIRSYDGPEVTSILAFKGDRTLALLHHDRVLRRYRFELGFNPIGHKLYEGDGRTPEGRYRIDRRNPKSSFHLSLGISYPNRLDAARAHAIGRRPGGDIFIHGTPSEMEGKDDWTAGCIAVTNRQIEEIYAMVRTGTLIDIRP